MFDFVVSPAMAQAASPQTPNPLVSLLPFAIIFFIFYFLMIRPQKKRLQAEQTLLKSLAKGDEIYTKSGILGTIVAMTEKIVTLEVSEGAKIKVLRDQIGGKTQGLFEKNPAPSK